MTELIAVIGLLSMPTKLHLLLDHLGFVCASGGGS